MALAPSTFKKGNKMELTTVFVHGAYADASSWNGVISALCDPDPASPWPTMIAFANPLRGLSSDTQALGDLLATLEGPVVLVGHSYGGAVMSGIDPGVADVRALVYVAGFALTSGESCADASALAPGSTLGETLTAVSLTSGGADTYIGQDEYHQQFCADLPAEQARLMAVTQRPVTQLGLSEPAIRSLWKAVPSWFIFGELDRNIPAAAHRVMADRAGARKATELPGASYVVGISHCADVAMMVREASKTVAGTSV